MVRLRLRAEECERVSIGQVRHCAQRGAEQLRLPDGTAFDLLWRPVRGCFGGREGLAMLFRCPRCQRGCRVLRRPSRQQWGCRLCVPVSHRSHRRSGSHGAARKPPSWFYEQITEQQQRAVERLGLAQWPPPPLLWGLADLEALPRRACAPRLSHHRREALRLRIDALETLRVVSVLAPALAIDPEAEMAAAVALQMVEATEWAMRRPARDWRTTRARCTETLSRSNCAA